MLYSIMPPILIILSLVGIILFLMKKSEKVERIAEAEKMNNSGSSLFEKAKVKIGNIKTERVKQIFLSLLEKITRRLRLIFLKLESKFNAWSGSIRNKRNLKKAEEKKAEEKKAIEPNVFPEKSNRKKSDIFKKLKDYSLAKRKDITKENMSEIEERPVRPMIGEKVVFARPSEVKGRLEELLIERIAVNPKDVEAYERLGEYYMEIRSLEDSKECFKQVIKLDPLNRNARYRMKRLENLLAKK